MLTAKLILLYMLEHTFDMEGKIDPEQAYCVALNVYHESRGETIEDQFGVAHTIMNRVSDPRYPGTACDVVKDALGPLERPYINKCQFSWYCEGKQSMEYLTRHNKVLYNDIINLAVDVYANHDKMNDPSKGALFYHADYVRPVWRKNLDKVAVIGKHIFYNDKEVQ